MVLSSLWCLLIYTLRPKQNGFGYHIGYTTPDSKVHGANTGSTWGRQDPGGPCVGHMNLAVWNIFKCILLNENICILINMSLECILSGTVDSKLSLLQIMTSRQTGDKPFFNQWLPILPIHIHICITWLWWVNISVKSILTINYDDTMINCFSPSLFMQMVWYIICGSCQCVC